MYVVNNFNCRGFGPLLEDKLCLIFKLAPSVCRMTFPILASLLVRLVVLLPFQLLRLSLATPSRWTPLALSVFLHCVVDRKSGSAGMPRPISYAVFCLKKKKYLKVHITSPTSTSQKSRSEYSVILRVTTSHVTIRP